MRGRYLSITAAAVLALCAVCPARAQDTARQQARKATLEKEIAQIERQLQDNSARSTNALNELTLIRKKLANRKELLADSEREIKVLSDSISRAQRNADSLSARIGAMGESYARLVKGAYRNRNAQLWYIYLLTSEDLGQAGRRYSYLKSLSSQMNAEGRRIKDARSQLDTTLAVLSRMKVRAEDLRDRRKQEMIELSGDEKRSDNLVAQLGRDKRKYQKELNEKRRQVEALNKEIERIIAEYMAELEKKQDEAGDRKEAPRTIDYKLAAEFENNRGRLPWPADGPVLEGFGRHTHPVYTSLVMPFNNGINIGLLPGDEVRAVFDGEVRSIIVMPGYNKCVLVQHGSYFTFYCKLSEVYVKSYDKVRTGQPIGKVDTIDGQTQLHFQIWKERTPQDPQNWLRPDK